MNDCCHPPEENESGCHNSDQKRVDWLFWFCLLILSCPILLHISPAIVPSSIEPFLRAETQIISQMWIGMAIGIFTVGLMNLIPSKLILNTLGREANLNGLIRATLAGVLLDLCNHGILLIAAKLYRSGVRYSQVLAFLIASPWNSLSLTVVMFALLGWKWTFTIIFLSLLVALITGWVVQQMEKKGLIPDNPHHEEVEASLTLKDHFHKIKTERGIFKAIVVDGFKDSKTIMRWLLLGMVLAALMQSLISNEHLQEWFGASTQGLAMTLLFATILEVCSEGLLPIAADLLTRAAAPGNAFAFLMAGVSTDYTEILTLKEATGQWKMAFLLPLISLPQIIVIAMLLNQF